MEQINLEPTSSNSVDSTLVEHNVVHGQVGDRYLRGRPFLIVEAIGGPAKGVRTEGKGWSKEAKNWDIREKAHIVERINNKEMYSCDIIIDILNRKLVKNRYGEMEDTLVDRYMQRYHDKVIEGMNKWAALQKANEKANSDGR